jgi:hypothetical protein
VTKTPGTDIIKWQPSTAAIAPCPTAAVAPRFVLVDLDTLRALLREVIADTQPGAPPEFYSQTCLPPGMTRRAFLDAIRRGDLPARAAGKVRFVAREDYRAFVAKSPPVSARLRAQPTPANDVRALVRASRGR